MNTIERKLIEIRQALLKQSTNKESASSDLLQRAHLVLSGNYIETGSGDDIVIVNNQDKCEIEELPGPQGPPGPPGPPGPAISCNCSVATITIDADYTPTAQDCFIKVVSTTAVTISLPIATDGKVYIIKVGMGPPIGNKKITINTVNDLLIDGKNSIVLTTPYSSKTLVYDNLSWYTI